MSNEDVYINLWDYNYEYTFKGIIFNSIAHVSFDICATVKSTLEVQENSI